ncbi:MAG: hypothetical protein EBY09_18810 [Verrucomicrobia bacterium]|nr:hypothetical protein [Verrucomicrobiota bacterium]NDF00567.1 hypothetical protein [Verrucomicrobiota bacterium]
MRKNVRVVQLVGSVGEPLAARPPRGRGDDRAIARDGEGVVPVVVRDVNLAGAASGLGLECNAGLRNALGARERHDHIVRKRVSELAGVRAGVGLGEEVVFLAVGDVAFEARTIGPAHQHDGLLRTDDGATGHFEIEAQRAGHLAGEAAEGNDGKWIAFTTQRGEFEICVVPASGGEVQSLVPGQDPTWAPNSRTIMFSKRGRGGPLSLSLLDVPTKRVKDVPLNLGNCSQPAWAR